MEEHRESVVMQIREWYADDSVYGEVSQLQHALQCAEQGKKTPPPQMPLLPVNLRDCYSTD